MGVKQENTWMNIYMLSFLSVTVVLVINLSRCEGYRISRFKVLLISLLEIVMGVFGTQVLFLVENGSWGGTSFFGAVLFLPVFFMPLKSVLRIPYSTIMDIIAPSGLSMYVVNKINCYVAGCCCGKVMGFSSEGIPIYFPSQIAEAITVITIVTVLLFLEHRRKYIGKLYPFGLVLYGATRLVLNFFREEWGKLQIVGSFGTLWSVVAIGIGAVWISSCKQKAYR